MGLLDDNAIRGLIAARRQETSSRAVGRLLPVRDGLRIEPIAVVWTEPLEANMRRIIIAVVLGAALGGGGVCLAFQGARGRAGVKTLFDRDVIEKLDGKDARVTMVELAIEPGKGGPPHRHPGPVFGYVLEGQFELALGDEPVRTLEVGDTFYEPTGILHRVSRNPNPKTRTRVLAVLLRPRDAKVTTPAKAREK